MEISGVEAFEERLAIDGKHLDQIQSFAKFAVWPSESKLATGGIVNIGKDQTLGVNSILSNRILLAKIDGGRRADLACIGSLLGAGSCEKCIKQTVCNVD